MPSYQGVSKVTLFGLSKPVADEQRQGEVSGVLGRAPVHQWRDIVQENSEGLIYGAWPKIHVGEVSVTSSN